MSLFKGVQNDLLYNWCNNCNYCFCNCKKITNCTKCVKKHKKVSVAALKTSEKIGVRTQPTTLKDRGQDITHYFTPLQKNNKKGVRKLSPALTNLLPQKSYYVNQLYLILLFLIFFCYNIDYYC